VLDELNENSVEVLCTLDSMWLVKSRLHYLSLLGNSCTWKANQIFQWSPPTCLLLLEFDLYVHRAFLYSWPFHTTTAITWQFV